VVLVLFRRARSWLTQYAAEGKLSAVVGSRLSIFSL
jgi:hypothetical protein